MIVQREVAFKLRSNCKKKLWTLYDFESASETARGGSGTAEFGGPSEQIVKPLQYSPLVTIKLSEINVLPNSIVG